SPEVIKSATHVCKQLGGVVITGFGDACFPDLADFIGAGARIFRPNALEFVEADRSLDGLSGRGALFFDALIGCYKRSKQSFWKCWALARLASFHACPRIVSNFGYNKSIANRGLSSWDGSRIRVTHRLRPSH